MNRSIFFLIFMSVFFIVGCNETHNAVEIGKDNDKGSNTANKNRLTLEHNSLTREYVLFVPSNHNSTTAIPLMFNFHGFGGNAIEYMIYADMRSLAESENFILVYP